MDNEKISFYMNEKNQVNFSASVHSFYCSNGTTYGATSSVINDAMEYYYTNCSTSSDSSAGDER